MSFLKPKPATSSSTSSNLNNGLITSTYGGQMGTGVSANNFLAQLLGVPTGGGGGGGSGGSGSPGTYFDYRHDGISGNAAAARAAGQPDHGYLPGTSTAGSGGTGSGADGSGGAQAGYNNYLQNAGFAPAMRQLSQNITGQGAAAGILNSGSTAKALQTRGTELNQSFFNNYLQQLAGLSGLGLQAGGLVTNAGQTSSSTSQGGGPSTLGTIASIAGSIAPLFSDRRLKRDIERVGEFADGLGIYAYRYLMGAKRVLGVMADEVARLRPWALGPARAGFATVDYGAL